MQRRRHNANANFPAALDVHAVALDRRA
jgi:hypothetical protein